MRTVYLMSASKHVGYELPLTGSRKVLRTLSVQ
jgi:hypothetical protein